MDKELYEKAYLCWHPGAKFEKLDEKYDIDVAVYVDNRSLFVVFMGSVSLTDWKMNFRFWQAAYKRMEERKYVHAGFKQVYHKVRDQIHEVFRTFNYCIDTVVIRGFSHGAAIGTLCNEDFQWYKENNPLYSEVKIDALVCGSPRVCSMFGWKEFNRLSKYLIRVEVASDLVTRTPFSWMFYKHVGKKVRLGKRSFFDWIFPFLPKNFYTHHEDAYLKRLLNSNFQDDEGNNRFYPVVIRVYTKVMAIIMAVLLSIGILFML